MRLVKALGRLVDDYVSDKESYVEAARSIGALPASKVTNSLSSPERILSLFLSGTPSKRNRQEYKRLCRTS